MLVLFKQGTPTCSKIWGGYPTGKANEETQVCFFLPRVGLIQVKLLMSLPVWTALMCHFMISNLTNSLKICLKQN